jgi:RNA polymerase sigma-70 factor (ECF subfamily)
MLDGDEAAFATFFDTAYPVLYRFALARLRFDRDAAGDVAHATICTAIEKLHTYRGEAALLTWLCACCRGELTAHYRRHGQRHEIELLEDDPEIRAALEALPGGADDDLEASLDRHRLATIVQRVLDRLPPHYADALEWKYIDEVPVQEIGIRLGVGTKAAESLLSRARKAFRGAFRSLAPAWPAADSGKG